jgi:hypothetical protein
VEADVADDGAVGAQHDLVETEPRPVRYPHRPCGRPVSHRRSSRRTGNPAPDGALHGATVQDGPNLVHRHLAQAQAVRVEDLAVADPQVLSRR